MNDYNKLLYKQNIYDKWIEIYDKHNYIKDAIDFYKRNKNNILYYDEKNNIRLILLIFNRYNYKTNVIEKIGLTDMNEDGIIFLQINNDGTTIYLKLLQKRYEKRIAIDCFYNNNILIKKDDIYYYDNKYNTIIIDDKVINDEWF